MGLHRLDRLADAALTQYQRHLSPRKGFHCPAGLQGGTTCSAALRHIVQTQGLLAGRPAMMAQLRQCQRASQQLRLGPDPRRAVFCCIVPIPL
jgi:putative component of membrane protein insertase Oxa1/YidC/SpoIIIJ protein YidD